ncbi:MAG TPA: hypothetical protein VER32_03690 [Pyrinomonadaceae bacterium]|nr:hypothetical protein [Pyrinomonadaceae bacterium]
MSLGASRLLARASVVTLAVCCLAAHASAQQATAPTTTATRQASRQGPAAGDKPTPEEADLSITARVTAREVLFRKVPNPSVEFPGRPERRTLWEADRENLPEEVRPGVTYRDVGITLRIVSVFADIDRIVAEALGETPVTDDAAPAPPNATPPDDATPPSDTSPHAAASRADAKRRGARRATGTRPARTQP